MALSDLALAAANVLVAFLLLAISMITRLRVLEGFRCVLTIGRSLADHEADCNQALPRAGGVLRREEGPATCRRAKKEAEVSLSRRFSRALRAFSF